VAHNNNLFPKQAISCIAIGELSLLLVGGPGINGGPSVCSQFIRRLGCHFDLDNHL